MKHPVLGYCQGLNYIAGKLLLFLDDETAFWSLESIIMGAADTVLMIGNK